MESGQMNIRKATSQDLERIVYLFEQLGYSTGPDQVGEQLRELQQSLSGQAFVAEESGVVVGVAVVHLMKPLHVDASWALLSALVVDNKDRSSGLGSHLLSAAEGFAIEHGCSQLELSSSSTRTRAHMFYERNGYQEKRLRFVKHLP
jgi:ribosomal protein S18 acetylase RimI-like enzyme